MRDSIVGFLTLSLLTIKIIISRALLDRLQGSSIAVFSVPRSCSSSKLACDYFSVGPILRQRSKSIKGMVLRIEADSANNYLFHSPHVL